jgi:hypothetical protein
MPLPRVIVFGGRGFVAAFNDKSAPGGESIEFLEFEKDSSSWIAAEYTKAGGLERNPSRCTACHGAQTRPLWDAYSCWRGSYGEADDVLSLSEKSEIGKFIKGYKAHPRYSNLKNIETRFTVSTGTVAGRLDSAPNSSLQDFILEFDLKRSARIIKHSARYKEFKFALASALADCYTHRTRFAQKVSPGFKAALARETELSQAFYESRYQPGYNIECTKLKFSPEDVLVRTLLLASGDNPGLTFMSREHQDPTFLNHGYGRYKVEFLRSLVNGDSDFAVFDIDPQNTYRNFCEQLEAKGRVTLDFSAFVPDSEIVSRESRARAEGAKFDTPLTFAKCIACHSGADSPGPAIHFEDEQRLRKQMASEPQLRQKILDSVRVDERSGRSRMPELGSLNRAERQSIIDAIN